MRIIAKRRLREFWEKFPDSEQPLLSWYQEARAANWRQPSDIKAMYRNASIVANNRVVFNIKGNDYRLIVAFDYPRSIGFIKFIGTHEAYDQIDAGTVS